MKLETEGTLEFEPVTPQQLIDTLADDKGRGEFLILSKSDNIYIQAHGKGDGPYEMEHRDGDAEHHFTAGGTHSKADVQRAFLSYLSGDPQWRSDFQWQKLENKPWWKFW